MVKEIKKCFTKLFKDLDINELNDEIVKRIKISSDIISYNVYDKATCVEVAEKLKEVL